MARENSVSFKVFLLADDVEKPEVRRFGIDRDVSNFSYLSEKLQNVFPALRGKIFNVSWKDLDDDHVLISSDDELMIALTEMSGDVRKLYVTVKGNDPKERSSKFAGTSHGDVICDICEKSIVGFRYKCLECSNYDLCSACESKGCHPEHFMIRLPVPVSWRPHFGKRLAHHLSKSARRCHSNVGRDEANANGDTNCPFGHARGCSHGYHHGNHHSGWLDFMSTLVGDIMKPYAEDASCPTEKHSENATSTCNGQTQTPEPGTPKSQAKSSKVNSDENVEYLLNVGKAVANFLDPLGIDVDFKVEHNKVPADSKETKPSKEETKKNVSFADEAKKSEDVFSGRKEKVATESSEKESPEKDGWTVVNENDASSQDVSAVPVVKEEKVAVKTQTQNAASVSVSTPNVDLLNTTTMSNATASGSTLTMSNATASGSTHTGAFPKTTFPPVFYPPVPQFNSIPVPPPPTQWQIPPPPFAMFPPANFIQPQHQPPMPLQQQTSPEQTSPLHSDPKINQAVEAMMSMGFSNDGGWLTQLVEMKNGDIGKVLDLLQPVKRT